MSSTNTSKALIQGCTDHFSNNCANGAGCWIPNIFAWLLLIYSSNSGLLFSHGQQYRDLFHISLTKKCSLIDINTPINITSNNISWCKCVEFNCMSKPVMSYLRHGFMLRLKPWFHVKIKLFLF